MSQTRANISLFLFFILSLPLVSPAQSGPNGKTVTVLYYSTPNGYVGRFVKSSNMLYWHETTGGGGSYSFKQTNTDEWSVYLRDESRKFNVQLDLFKKKVYMQQDGLAGAEMGTITHSWGYPANYNSVDCYNLGTAMYDNMQGGFGGHFTRGPGNTWTEWTTTGIHNFTQTGEKGTSVFLNDASRNMSVEIDLNYRAIYVEPNSTGKRKIGSILFAWDIPYSQMVFKAANAKMVNYQSLSGGTGFFQKNANGQWTENAGGVLHTFTQYNQDEWSVYIKDASRSMDIQIDLFQKKIYVEPFGAGRRQIATITSVQGAN